jgi:hypothetical protein
MSLRTFGLQAAALIVGAIAGPCFAFDAQCPQSINTTQHLGTAIRPWQEFSRDPWGATGGAAASASQLRSGFSRIELYDGQPRELADLVPDNERDTWTLGDPAQRTRPQFMACVYDGTYVRLVRQLPADVTRCHAAKTGKLHCEQASKH